MQDPASPGHISRAAVPWRRAVKAAARRLGFRFTYDVRPVARDWSLAVPFAYTPTPSAYRRAAVVHLFHPDMAQEMEQWLANLGGAVDVLITTDTDAKRDAIAPVFARWQHGQVCIRLVENRGRDIAPKLTAFVDRYNDYDLLLFVHSKRTDHSEAGRGWREKLLRSLAGSPQTVASIEDIFSADPAMGIVFPQHHEGIRQHVHWGQNLTSTKSLARKMDISLKAHGLLEMVSGSMFWARPAALAPVLGLGLKMEDFPPEPIGIDGTIAHAVERLFLFSCERAGMSWVKVADPQAYLHTKRMARVRSREELHRYLKKRVFRMLRAGASGRLVHRIWHL